MPLAGGDPGLAAIMPGWVATSRRTTASSSTTTTEIVIQSITWTANPGARYKITAAMSFQSSVASDNIRARIRYASGASVTTSGTELISVYPNADVASKGNMTTFFETVTGLTGQYTAGVTIVRDAGTGNVSSFGDPKMVDVIMVERV
jgi:hypothetical protein